jgi:dihydrofolate reductase
MSFSIIVAIAKNGVIGKDNHLPWNIPEDLKHFYKTVENKIVVMGKRTYESMGKPVRGAKNIVLSHNQQLKLDNCEIYHSFVDFLFEYQNSSQEIMVIGGAKIYQLFLPFVNKIYLTLIEQEFSGDTYFPPWQKKQWLVTATNSLKLGEYSCNFMVLVRTSSN